MEWIIMSDELEHAGKRGMHWGERNYQRKDGTWTPLGLKLRRLREGFSGPSRGAAPKAESTSKKEASREQADRESYIKKMERHEQEKQNALASGNAKKIAKYQSELSPEEVEDAISRINMMTRLDQAKEAQSKVKTDRLNRIVNTSKTALNGVVDIYDTTAAVANATGLIEKELPVIFKEQKRKGVTMFDRGREQRVQRGTATDEEERSYINDRSRRLERGTLSDEEQENYRRTIEDRQAHNVASERERADLERMNEQTRQRNRSILTPRANEYSRDEAESRNRQAATTAANADRLRNLHTAAREAYGDNDPRTTELANAADAMTNLSVIAADRAGRYNAANPTVRDNLRSSTRRQIDRAVNSDAAYRRARTPDEIRERDAELANRARQIDEAYSAVSNIDMDSINNRFSNLDNLASATPGSIAWQRERDRLRNTPPA